MADRTTHPPEHHHRRRHRVILGTYAVVALVMVGLSALFFVDAVTSDSAYRAVSAHRVEVRGTSAQCFPSPYRVGRSGSVGYQSLCEATYTYGGSSFTAVTPKVWPLVFEVDARNTGIRINQFAYSRGRVDSVSDVVVGAALLLGAGVVVVVHLLHRRRWGRTATAAAAAAAAATAAAAAPAPEPR